MCEPCGLFSLLLKQLTKCVKGFHRISIPSYSFGNGACFTSQDFKYLDWGFEVSLRYSVVIQFPKLGKSYSFWMMSQSFLRVGALETISTTLNQFYKLLSIYEKIICLIKVLIIKILFFIIFKFICLVILCIKN